MTSKKLPLWLVLQNADPRGDPHVMIYKNGDDLRQVGQNSPNFNFNQRLSRCRT
jgi:hypothetical protein